MSVNPAPARPAVPPAAGVPPHHAPRGGPGAAPVTVRAPALEALEAAPGQPARPTASTQAHRSAQHTAPEASGGLPRTAPPVPDIPEPPGPGEPVTERQGGRGHHARPDAAAERKLLRELPVRPADVCALGRRHGRWHPDSPEARICAGVQGG
ncbi:hypothetical protein ACFWSF_30670 [Streptomyces sp. NPDC058611]|uniref:hypothetical protein n=1 Tax=Streptomyces sp. NPDC058611 TaxID=3346554 RepID=UPI0036510BEE